MEQTFVGGQDPARRMEPIPDRPRNFRESACMSLHRAARVVEEQTAKDGGRTRLVSEYGPRASQFLHRSAESVRDVDAQKIKDNLKRQVELHPARSLLTAAAAGLFLGILFRRR